MWRHRIGLGLQAAHDQQQPQQQQQQQQRMPSVNAHVAVFALPPAYPFKGVLRELLAHSAAHRAPVAQQQPLPPWLGSKTNSNSSSSTKDYKEKNQTGSVAKAATTAAAARGSGSGPLYAPAAEPEPAPQRALGAEVNFAAHERCFSSPFLDLASADSTQPQPTQRTAADQGSKQPRAQITLMGAGTGIGTGAR